MDKETKNKIITNIINLNYFSMKTISLWATAIVSALFVVIACLDSYNWKLLTTYAVTMSIWMLIGWYGIHWKVFKHDLRVLSKSESPLKCHWIGTLIFFGIIILLVLAVIIGAVFLTVTQGLKLF